jgi:hypothetical protein
MLVLAAQVAESAKPEQFDISNRPAAAAPLDPGQGATAFAL